MIDYTEHQDTRCGFIAIIGRPNVGKSTLLNAILGKKISITSFRPQTTRYQILGIKTQANQQTVYIDTPGIHLGASKALNRQMNKIAQRSLEDINAVIFVIEALSWTEEDAYIAANLQDLKVPLFLAMNKVDLIADKTQLLAFMEKIAQILPHSILLPLSARKKFQVELLEKHCLAVLPPSPFYFPATQSVNHSDPFYVSELLREKMMRLLGQEIPYATSVQIEKFDPQPHIIHIHALIWVEREGQKRVVIGDKGDKLKEIGSLARVEAERYFNKKVCLKLWVKVNARWTDNPKALAALGLS